MTSKPISRPAPPASRHAGARRAGRPDAQRAGEIRTQILAAARALFLEQGADFTTMEAVAAAAGVSKGTLYARFPCKGDLLTAVIEDLLATLNKRATSSNHSLPEELAPRLREYARRIVSNMEWNEYQELSVIFQRASRTNAEVVRTSSERAVALLVQTLASDMEHYANRVRPVGKDWASLAALLIFSVTGWFNNAKRSGKHSEAEFERYLDVVVSAVVAQI